MTFVKTALIVVPAIAFALGAPANARADLVQNGGFEATSNGAGLQFDRLTTVDYWTSTNGNNDAYNLLFANGTADTTGVTAQYGNLQLWGSNNGGNSVLPLSSPDGGNFVASDGTFQLGPISQAINGLTAGGTYTVGFYWAAGQESGYDGDTTGQWHVSFGNQTQSTEIITNPSHGFTDWMYKSFDFTASNSSEVLSFLAAGAPDGLPPFVLLDGVSVVPAVPEPSSLSLILIGAICAGAVKLRRRPSRNKTA
jgi:hypothetical protein